MRRGFILLLGLSVVWATAGFARDDIAYLAFDGEYWQVRVLDSTTGRSRQLTRSAGDKTRVSWFPGGQELLICVVPGVAKRLTLEGNETAIVGLAPDGVLDAVISPDGKTIAYSYGLAASRDGNDLWLAELDGSNVRRLWRAPALQHEPVWSADGKSLLFLSGSGGQSHDIWRVDVATGAAEALTVNELYHFDFAIAPDGAWAYSGNRTGHYDIWYQAPNKRAEALTSDAAFDAAPSFAPDGQRLVFESTRASPGVPNLWTLDIPTRKLKRLTSEGRGARRPAWLTPSVARSP